MKAKKLSIVALSCIAVSCAATTVPAFGEVAWRTAGRSAARNLKEKDYAAAISGYNEAIALIEKSNPDSEAKYDLYMNLAESYRLNNQIDRAKGILDQLEPEILKNKWNAPFLKVRYLRRRGELWWSLRDSQRYAATEFAMLKQCDSELDRGPRVKIRMRISILWKLIELQNWRACQIIEDEILALWPHLGRSDAKLEAELSGMRDTMFLWLSRAQTANDWNKVVFIAALIQPLENCVRDPARNEWTHNAQVGLYMNIRNAAYGYIRQGNLAQAEQLMSQLEPLDPSKGAVLDVWLEWVQRYLTDKDSVNADAAIASITHLLSDDSKSTSSPSVHQRIEGQIALCSLLEQRHDSHQQVAQWGALLAKNMAQTQSLSNEDLYQLCSAVHRCAELLPPQAQTDKSVVLVWEQLIKLLDIKNAPKAPGERKHFLWMTLTAHINLARIYAKTNRPEDAVKVLESITPATIADHLPYYQRNLVWVQLEACKAFCRLKQFDKSAKLFAEVKSNAAEHDLDCKKRGVGSPNKLFAAVHEFEEQTRQIPQIR